MQRKEIMLKEIGTYVRIADLLLAVLLILDRGVKSTLVIAIVVFISSVIVQIMLSYKRLKIANNYN